MKRLSTLILILNACLQISGQVILQTPLSPRVTGYDITGSLNTKEHTVSGKMLAWWVNTTSAPVPDALLNHRRTIFLLFSA